MKKRKEKSLWLKVEERFRTWLNTTNTREQRRVWDETKERRRKRGWYTIKERKKEGRKERTIEGWPLVIAVGRDHSCFARSTRGKTKLRGTRRMDGFTEREFINEKEKWRRGGSDTKKVE